MRNLLIATLLLLPTAASAQDYRLVWSDEFDGVGAPDSTKWTYERGFVRNEEHQWYQPENARMAGGTLTIEAKRETKPNPTYEAGSANWRRGRQNIEYTSTSMTTRGLHTWQYGRFEMRARIDTRPGMWPAFWTLGASGGWPAGGEIDIMEYYRGMILANAAWAADDRGTAAWDDSKTPLADLGGAEWARWYHVWRMDWDEREIRFYVDERLLNSVDLTRTTNGDGSGRNPLRQPHHIILNLAVGGTQGGDPSGTQFPARYEIDWVRVYQAR